MLTDRFGQSLTTSSPAARDLYDEALWGQLIANPGVIETFRAARDADPGFALAHVGEARALQMFGRMDEARAAIAAARDVGKGLTPRETAHLDAFADLIEGRPRDGYAKVRAHLRDHPRDALACQTCTGVFSLIGFSGQPGREAEQLAFCHELAPHYGDDGWFLSQLAFAQLEVGQLDRARSTIDRALDAAPRSAHGAHVRAHLYYEAGETRAGLDYLGAWMESYDRSGLMHCHNSWHIALWALATDDEARVWSVIDADLVPEVSQSPPLNILTDLAALYCRAELAGLTVPRDRWQALSGYAARMFPNPGLAFADVHAALAHAMAGDGEALNRIMRDARGPAADVVAASAEGFAAFARQNWTGAVAALTPVMADHARLGGSKAQRDLIEYAVAAALLRQGKTDEARRLLAIRRPHTDLGRAVSGLDHLRH